MNQPVKFSSETLEELVLYLKEIPARKVFLVTGKASYEASGSASLIEPVLSNFETVRFSEFTTNPVIEDVHKGIHLYSEFGPEVVIAVGGGSVLDMAKIVNFWAVNEVDEGGYLGGSEPGAIKGVPLVAIPTTAGSGSEATRFATLYVGRTKHSVEHGGLLPDKILLIPSITQTLPPYETAASGIDALGHALESYWNIRSTDRSKKYARSALTLILSNIVAAVRNPDLKIRAAMLEGAYQAGKAINITRTTAAHAISYPLTAHFNVPHGHAVGLILPSLLAYNADVHDGDIQDPRGCPYVADTFRELSEIFETNDVSTTVDKLDSLLRETGLETSLGGLGINEEDVKGKILDSFDPIRAGNNPRRVTKEALEAMLRNIL